MPGKMARSDHRPSVRVTRGAGSGQHLGSVLQEAGKTRTLMPVWDSSGESRYRDSPDELRFSELAELHISFNQLPLLCNHCCECSKSTNIIAEYCSKSTNIIAQKY